MELYKSCRLCPVPLGLLFPSSYSNTFLILFYLLMGRSTDKGKGQQLLLWVPAVMWPVSLGKAMKLGRVRDSSRLCVEQKNSKTGSASKYKQMLTVLACWETASSTGRVIKWKEGQLERGSRRGLGSGHDTAFFCLTCEFKELSTCLESSIQEHKNLKINPSHTI